MDDDLQLAAHITNITMEKERKRNTRGRDLIDKLKTTKTEPKKVTNTWEPFGMMIAMVFRK